MIHYPRPLQSKIAFFSLHSLTFTPPEKAHCFTVALKFRWKNYKSWVWYTCITHKVICDDLSAVNTSDLKKSLIIYSFLHWQTSRHTETFLQDWQIRTSQTCNTSVVPFMCEQDAMTTQNTWHNKGLIYTAPPFKIFIPACVHIFDCLLHHLGKSYVVAGKKSSCSPNNICTDTFRTQLIRYLTV